MSSGVVKKSNHKHLTPTKPMPRVLVIDDDEQVRALLYEILDRAGFEVIEATNGGEALQLYRTRPTDLVITDLIMPEKEGVETILELRREVPPPRVLTLFR